MIVKALVLTVLCIQGIKWFWQKNFDSIMVIFTLMISMGLVISEMAFRFTRRSLRYRFIQNALAMWMVFLCMTVMLGFTRKNDAAKLNSKVPLRMIFIPIHCLYATLLFWGLFVEGMG